MISLLEEENKVIDEILKREYNPLADNVMNGNVLEKLDEFTADEKTTNFPTFEVDERLFLGNVSHVRVAKNLDAIPVGKAFENIFDEIIIGLTEDLCIIVKLDENEE